MVFSSEKKKERQNKKAEFLLSIPEAEVIAVPRKPNADYVMEKMDTDRKRGLHAQR